MLQRKIQWRRGIGRVLGGVGEGLTEKVTLSLEPEESQGRPGRRAFWAEGRASAEVLREETAWDV